jgi:superfamily II DNA/RNA helicase
MLLKRPRIVVATLGRLLEMLDKEYIGLEGLEIMALDEADKFNVKGKKKTW